RICAPGRPVQPGMRTTRRRRAARARPSAAPTTLPSRRRTINPRRVRATDRSGFRGQTGRPVSARRTGQRAPVYFPAMSVRPIVLLGDPRLRLKGLPVDSFGKLLHGLLDDLADTMRHAPGVGLAAPQLGEALQVCVIEVRDTLYELVNPRIVRAAGDDRDLEGFLSLPGY